jgi:hypothetical protein
MRIFSVLLLSCLPLLADGFIRLESPFAVDTNGLSSANGTVYNQAPLHVGLIEGYDDFSGPAMRSTAFLQRRSPSGHSYYLYSTTADGTNGFLMTNGVIRQTQEAEANTSFYLSVSNTVPNGRPWNRFGARLRWRYDGVNLVAPYQQMTMLINDMAIPSGGAARFLHNVLELDGSLTVQSNAFTLSQGAIPTFAGYTKPHIIWEMSCFSNSVVHQVNGYVESVFHTNMAILVNQPVIMWQISGSGTSAPNAEIDAIWWGYADPALEFLANKTKLIGDSMTELARITRPTLTTGTYTNSISDTHIGIPNGSVRTNKLAAIGGHFGREVTIYDDGHSAAGTNIWIVPIDGGTINGGPPLTNIAANGGSITFISSPTGYRIKSRFP